MARRAGHVRPTYKKEGGVASNFQLLFLCYLPLQSFSLVNSQYYWLFLFPVKEVSKI